MAEINQIKTRKYGKHLRVPVLLEEENKIKENATHLGLSVAEYLRRISLAYSVQSVIDKNHILTLAKINADLGRLGGLLKLWLTNDERLKQIAPDVILALLERIKKTQAHMFDVVKRL